MIRLTEPIWYFSWQEIVWIGLPIILGLGKFKFAIISTNSSMSFVKRGLYRFSSATLLSNWPLKKEEKQKENEDYLE